MSWSVVAVSGRAGERTVSGEIRYSTSSENLVELDFGAHGHALGRGADLFAALCDARQQLESDEVYVACNGARRDVYPSAMQRQATNGRRAYVLTLPRTRMRLQVVDIFEPTDAAQLGTVEEQRAWFDRWSSSIVDSA